MLKQWIPRFRFSHLKDDPADVELVQATLAEAGLACRITRAQTRDEFETGLRDHWDGYYPGGLPVAGIRRHVRAPAGA